MSKMFCILHLSVQIFLLCSTKPKKGKLRGVSQQSHNDVSEGVPSCQSSVEIQTFQFQSCATHWMLTFGHSGCGWIAKEELFPGFQESDEGGQQRDHTQLLVSNQTSHVLHGGFHSSHIQLRSSFVSFDGSDCVDFYEIDEIILAQVFSDTTVIWIVDFQFVFILCFLCGHKKLCHDPKDSICSVSHIKRFGELKK